MPRRNRPKDLEQSTTGRRRRRPLPPAGASAIAVLRAALDLLQNEVSDGLGVTTGVLSDLEAGRRTLLPPRKAKLLDVLTLPPDALNEAAAFVLSIRAKAKTGGQARTGEEAARLRRDGAIRRIEAAAGSFARVLIDELDLEDARREAERLWEEIERLAPERRRTAIRRGPRYHKWALCELLCQKSLDAAGDSAATAMDLAALAVLVAKHAPGLPAWRRRLQGYARAHLANALRVHGKLAEAEQEFARAKELWESGADERKVLNEARVLGMEASLLLEQGHLTEALNLLELADGVDRGAEHKKIFMVNRACVLALLQDFAGAIETLREVVPLISEEHEPRLLASALFDLADHLLHAQPEEAMRLLPGLQRLTRRLGKRLDGLRLRWLEGRLASALGEKENAFILLSQVRDEFAELGMSFDTALATLELTPLLLEQRRPADVFRLARQLEQIFRAQGAHEKALEAVLIYRKAAEQQALTLEMVRRLSAYFERARYNPALRFEAEEQGSPSPGRV